MLLSSAHEKWSLFQEYVEENMKLDIEDHENLGTRCIRSGSIETKNLCFNGRRLFIQHWEQMVKSNGVYAMTVQRALKSVGGDRNEESFATQYDNLFLSVKTSTFFDAKQLLASGTCFQQYNPSKYINNEKYVIVAGVDFAIVEDISDMTIKAIPNGWGTDRDSILIAKYVLNPSKDKGADAIVKQLNRVYDYVVMYNVQYIIFDETGLGKSAPELFKELLRKKFYTKLPESNVFGIEFKANRRTEILEHYWGRIQSGKEILPMIDKAWTEEETMKPMYMNAVKRIDEGSCYIRHLYEHMMFNRTETKNNKGELCIDYRQSDYKWLHK